jgi:hypothetical protein
MRKNEKLSMDEIRDEAIAFGYDGESVKAVHDMADIFKVSQEFRDELVHLYEESYFNW